MQAFARYLEDTELTCSSFAALLGVEDSTVWRWRYGKGTQRRSPSLGLALRIERLTKGAVPVSSWDPFTQASASAPKKRKPPRVRRPVRRGTNS